MKLSINDISASLDLPITTIERWIRQGRIPIKKVGDEYRFSPSVLTEWAKVHNLRFIPPEHATQQKKETEQQVENLITAIRNGGVFHNVEGDDVDSVLKSGVALIPGLEESEREALYAGLLERERLASTGVGKGVALPHPRSPIAGIRKPSFITTCFLKHPVDYGAIDDQPVFVLFFLVCPDVKRHLHLLSRISYCIRDNGFIQFLKSRPDEETFITRITQFEKQLERSDR